MDTGIIVAMITGALTIAGASITYFQTKHKDREQERHRLKTDSYKELLIALSRAIRLPRQNPTAEQSAEQFENQQAFYSACHSVDAVASESIVKALNNYIRATNDLALVVAMKRADEEIGIAFNAQVEKYSELMYEIRAELGAPSDNLLREEFTFMPWVANPNVLIADQKS
ncbi:MAG: hypothetical protein ACHQM6_05225 [Candidatus Kapaibacterium sp.]